MLGMRRAACSVCTACVVLVTGKATPALPSPHIGYLYIIGVWSFLEVAGQSQPEVATISGDCGVILVAQVLGFQRPLLARIGAVRP